MSRAIYIVKKGDTLGKIAKAQGTTVARLQTINGIKDPDQINEGQVIALSARAVCKVDVQLLDAYRNPLKNTKVRLDYRGKSKRFSSGSNGRLPTILTSSPEDKVTISVHRTDGDWKQVAEVISGWGNKLVTLVSPKVKISTKTMPHPREDNGKLKRDESDDRKRSVKPPEHPRTTQGKGVSHGDYGDGKGPKSLHITRNRLPITKITNDQVELDFLGGYTGDKITESDYLEAAKKLGCEVSFIKAVAMIETGDKDSGFDEYNRPIILYERHVFMRNTNPKGKYNITNPDISSRVGYKPATAQNLQLIKQGKLSSDEVYRCSYRRLSKAYALDRNAALRACSWGIFQILGENHLKAGFDTVLAFVRAMCISEKEHLKALVNFIKSDKRLIEASISKDWTAFAEAYNGKKYKINRYDSNLKEAYRKVCKKIQS